MISYYLPCDSVWFWTIEYTFGCLRLFLSLDCELLIGYIMKTFFWSFWNQRVKINNEKRMSNLGALWITLFESVLLLMFDFSTCRLKLKRMSAIIRMINCKMSNRNDNQKVHIFPHSCQYEIFSEIKNIETCNWK